LDCYAAAANCRLPSPVEHFEGQHMRRRQNAGARLRFCPLQGIELFVLFLEFRGRSGIPHQESLSNPCTGFFLATCRAKPGPPTGAVLNLLAARVTGENTLACGDARGYIGHVQFPFAGCALQRGPAFSLPGTGQLN
jgi:hypothetical protein